MTQMTNPAPTYEQVWSWKRNIEAGTSLYKTKQKLAKQYLGQKNRTYSEEQLKLETWSRWNGGSYHTWNEEAKSWERNPTMLCDSKTGNIGWNMNEPENQGKTEADLHERDKSSYKNPKKDKTNENKWKYTGICYADHITSK